MSSKTVVSVLVIGYGNAGSAIIRALTASQYKDRIDIAILVRPSSIDQSVTDKAIVLSSLRASGARLLAGDIESDNATLIATLRGIDIVISTVGAAQIKKQIPLIKAAVAARVKYFIPSEFGYDYRMMDYEPAMFSLLQDKMAVHEELIKSDLDYTIIHTGAFGELGLSPFFGVNIPERTVIASGSADSKITLTGVNDIGALVARVILSPAARNIHIHLAGDTVSYQDIAAAIESVTKKSVTIKVQSAAESESLVEANPNDVASRLSLIHAKQKGCWWDKSTSWNALNAPDYKPASLIELIQTVIGPSA